jgi:DNA helicase-2/ATP-dependent DNA helicase PcrA
LQLLDGVGPATAGKILDQIASADPLLRLGTVGPPPRAAAAWRELVTLFAQLAAARSAWPAELDAVRRWYQPLLEARYDDARMRASDLEQLQRIAALYPSRGKFLTDLALDPPGATADAAGAPLRDEDYLILSTIHSAKGQEWKAVLVLNAVDGCIPSDMATGSTEEIEEERRLLYVAMTRAKDRLALVVPQRFYIQQQARTGDRHVYAARTRFIPERIRDSFQCTGWPAARRGGGEPAARLAAPIDLGARVRARWRGAGA